MSVIDLEEALEFWEMRQDLIDLINQLAMAVPLSDENPETIDDEASIEIMMRARAAIEKIDSLGKKEDKNARE